MEFISPGIDPRSLPPKEAEGYQHIYSIKVKTRDFR
jgi:hypothetical protein